MSDKLHVCVTRGGWAVRRTGTARAWKRFPEKRKALRFAVRNANGREVVVHQRDGIVERVIGAKG